MTSLSSPEHPHAELGALNPEKLGNPDVVERSIVHIHEVEAMVTETLDLVPGSAEAEANTDEALVYMAESTDASSDATQGEMEAAITDVLIKSEIELEEGVPAEETPVWVLENDGYDQDVRRSLLTLAESQATLPGSDVEISRSLTDELDTLSAHPIMAEPGTVEYVAQPKSAESAKQLAETLRSSKDTITVQTSIDMSPDEKTQYASASGIAASEVGGYQNLGNQSQDIRRLTELTKTGAPYKSSQTERISFVKNEAQGKTDVVYRFGAGAYKDDLGRPGNQLTMSFQLGEAEAATLYQQLETEPTSIQSMLEMQLGAIGVAGRVGGSIEAARVAESMHMFNIEEYAADGTRMRSEQISSVPKYETESLGVEALSEAELADAKVFAQRWIYTEGGELAMNPMGAYTVGENARSLLESGAFTDDAELKTLVDAQVETLHARHTADTADIHARLEGMRATRETIPEDFRGGIDAAIATLTAKAGVEMGDDAHLKRTEVVQQVTEVLARRERELLTKAIEQRIAQDKVPWTMPGSEVPNDQMDWFKVGYENIIRQETEPSPDDVFTIARPMSGIRAPEDIALLAASGIDFAATHKVTRQDLQESGVFFVNRIGDGEQPILGVAIPDPDSPTGFFDAGSRSVLTKTEFDKVYAYQQEHGYGIDGADPTDVQMDMIAFGMRHEMRARGIKKTVHPGSRVNKYHQVFSPFVDSGYRVQGGRGLEGYVEDTEEAPLFGKGQLRMNEITVHLVNAHPDYPGLSEMFDEKAAHDQKYMSAGEYMKIYQAPPTPEDALFSLSHGIKTNREQAWVGPLSRIALDY